MIERLLFATGLIVALAFVVSFLSARFRQAEDTEQMFREDIAGVIVSYTPISPAEILDAYDQFGSWDKVIAACMYASESGDTLRTALRKVWKP